MNRYFMAGVVALAGVLGLAGCSDKPEPKVQVAASAPSAAAPAPTFPPGPYTATLAEGIDFKRQGYPDFLGEVSGMSVHEPWGRWTDAAAGPVARFRFKQALPRKFTLEITAHAFGPNTGEPVKVRVGGVAKTFVITKNEADTLRLEFETDGAADTLEITPPKPASPKEIDPNNGDTRKLGIAFISLKIKESFHPR